VGLLLELIWRLFGDVIIRRTGDAILYVLTLGRYRPGEDDEWPPWVVGGIFWLAVLGAVVYFSLRRR
jgi:hypothetical protein